MAGWQGGRDWWQGLVARAGGRQRWQPGSAGRPCSIGAGSNTSLVGSVEEVGTLAGREIGSFVGTGLQAPLLSTYLQRYFVMVCTGIGPANGGSGLASARV